MIDHDFPPETGSPAPIAALVLLAVVAALVGWLVWP
jgi:hypothetical protein